MTCVTLQAAALKPRSTPVTDMATLFVRTSCFFQESVPNFAPAAELVEEADIFVVIGTSLVVYPAASLISYVRRGVPIYYIDPHPADTGLLPVTVIREKATTGVQKLAEMLLADE